MNSADNGVWLTKNSKVINQQGTAIHSKLHTKVYFANVDEMVTAAYRNGAGGKAKATARVKAALDEIRQDLLNNNITW